MNRLNGPYSYSIHRSPIGDMWDITDNTNIVVALCETSHLAQIVASALTEAWKRQTSAIKAAERTKHVGYDTRQKGESR